jgi:hypothetical protein
VVLEAGFQSKSPGLKPVSLVGFFRGLKPPANPVEQTTTKARATARATTNAGVLRYAQDDDEKLATATTGVLHFVQNDGIFLF